MKYTVLVFAALLLFSCGKKETEKLSNNFSVSGKIENLKPGTSLYLEALDLANGRWLRVDSANCDSTGKYDLQYTVTEPDLFRISWDRDYLICIVDSNRQVITLNADARNPYLTMQAKGSQATERFIFFNNRLMQLNAKGDSLEKEIEVVRKTKDKAKEEQLLQERVAQRGVFDDYIKSEVTAALPSLTAMLILEYLDINTHLDFYVEVNQKLQATVPQSRFAAKINERVTALAATRFAPGHPAPDFTLYNPDGKSESVSKYKGKILLLDFWASWCGPCRAENPNVVKLYNTYRGKGLEILSVSLDKTREPWLEAIAADRLIWNHAWDHAGNASQLYRVTQIPSTFLIDREGKIIAQNLRGEALEQKVAELLK